MWWVLEKDGYLIRYINMIKYVHDG